MTTMYCMIHIQDPIIINSNIFSHSGIFRTPCISCIFRTLAYLELKIYSKLCHILVYSKRCVMLAYWESKAYSIISYKITLTFFFLNFNLTYFSIKFQKNVFFLTKMTSVSMLDRVYLNYTWSLKIALQ